MGYGNCSVTPFYIQRWVVCLRQCIGKCLDVYLVCEVTYMGYRDLTCAIVCCTDSRKDCNKEKQYGKNSSQRNAYFCFILNGNSVFLIFRRYHFTDPCNSKSIQVFPTVECILQFTCNVSINCYYKLFMNILPGD